VALGRVFGACRQAAVDACGRWATTHTHQSRMSFSLFSRPHPLVQAAAEFELPDFELIDETQVRCGQSLALAIAMSFKNGCLLKTRTLSIFPSNAIMCHRHVFTSRV
jgi:hypothetical protein